MKLDLRCLAVLAVLLAGPGCLHPDVTEGPSPVPAARFVTVLVQYRQPSGCNNSAGTCDTRVVFYGSWMVPGQEVALDDPTGPLVWTGSVPNVPVNWPPVDQAHYVRVYDPHLLNDPTGGVTAARLTVGGQILTQIASPGTSKETALVYVDGSGVGHNPY